VLSGPLLYFVKPRLPVSARTHPRRLNFAFLKTSTFRVLQAGNILESLGLFIPNIYLPTYASSLGLSSISDTVTVFLYNDIHLRAGDPRQPNRPTPHHYRNPHLHHRRNPLHLRPLRFFASLPLLCIFSLVYGLIAGGFTSTYTGVIREGKRVHHRAEAGLIFGFIAARRGTWECCVWAVE